MDGILISHTDEDHISGIREILELTIEQVNPVKISCLYLPNWKNPPDSWLEKTAGAGAKSRNSGKNTSGWKMYRSWKAENGYFVASGECQRNGCK
ncbi:MAG: MBL fold metallo-hydrolase [Blautia sp.]